MASHVVLDLPTAARPFAGWPPVRTSRTGVQLRAVASSKHKDALAVAAAPHGPQHRSYQRMRLVAVPCRRVQILLKPAAQNVEPSDIYE